MIELAGLAPHEVADLIPDRPVFVGQVGSHSHGTYMPPSDPNSIDDVDIIVVYILPGLDHYFGLSGMKGPLGGKHRMHGQWDMAAYELREFVNLVAGTNPNLFGLLWLDERHWLLAEREWRALVQHRSLFDTRHAAKTFAHYAEAQLERMTAFRMTGEDVCCDGEKFHTTDCRMSQARGRGTQKKFATGHMGAKRKDLVTKYGFDAKNAAHTIRIYRMAIEYVRTGVLHLDRTGIDAEELIRIKTGKVGVDQIIEMAAGMHDQMQEALQVTPLPAAVDRDRINELLVSIMASSKMTDVAMIGNRFLVEGLSKREPLLPLGREAGAEPDSTPVVQPIRDAGR